MPKVSIAPDDWVVVCDGRKWLILENKGDAELPNLLIREERTAENPPTREQGSDRPGRSHSSVGRRAQRRRPDRLARPGRAGIPDGARPAA